MRHLAAILPLLALACARPMPPVSAEDSARAVDSARLAAEERVHLDSMRQRLDDPSTRCFQVEATAPRPDDIQAWQLALDTLPSGYYTSRPRITRFVRRPDGSLPDVRRLWGRAATDARELARGEWRVGPDYFWSARRDSLFVSMSWGLGGESLSGSAAAPTGERSGLFRRHSDGIGSPSPADTVAWRSIPCTEMSPPR